MAEIHALHSVGNSIVTYLRNAYPEELSARIPCTFRLVSSGELANDDDLATSISLYLYRVTVNEHTRNVGPPRASTDPAVPLSMNLHFLLSVWAENGLAEHTLLAWAMRELHLSPILDVSSLSPQGGFGVADQIQLIPEQLTNEDLMRIWDALTPSYRLSFSYVARVIRIEGRPPQRHRPVVARRFGYDPARDDALLVREGAS